VIDLVTNQYGRQHKIDIEYCEISRVTAAVSFKDQTPEIVRGPPRYPWPSYSETVRQAPVTVYKIRFSRKHLKTVHVRRRLSHGLQSATFQRLEAKMIATPCAVPYCPKLAEKRGRCTEHLRQYERNRGTASQRGYNAEWRRLRVVILTRDPVCRYERGCLQRSTEVDHIVPKARGGTNERSNLRGMCRYHNRSRSFSKGRGR
jgi:5-methylcytosine-specific restriction enzyme A